MWWKIIIASLYILIALAIGRYIFIRRSYFIMDQELCSLDKAKLITDSEYAFEWVLVPIIWPISLIVYLIFNVVDKAYIKIYEKSRNKSS